MPSVVLLAGSSQNGSSNPTSSPLLLFRKVSGESTHTATLPPEAVENDLTIHLWLICSGVCGMDVADVRQEGFIGLHHPSVSSVLLPACRGGISKTGVTAAVPLALAHVIRRDSNK